MNGRKHLYEGVAPQDTVRPLRALLKAGVKTVVLSNAAGGLNVKFNVGDLMLILDHVNFQFRNPLVGPNIDELGPRFPDMSQPYSRRLQDLARRAAAEEKIILREGVYIAGLGPSYETQAEVMMLRQFGDAVGMSTAPETLAAVHGGAEVLGVSVITNSLVHKSDVITSHEEVIQIGREAGEKFARLVKQIVQTMG
jgi:purine-nucleoside phosphorylase